ncbi:MAG: esterase/lipase family protein [Aquabacterium sp.]
MTLQPPGPLLLFLEARAPWELAALMAASPLMKRLKRGDGHSVLAFPGLAANDASTGPMRRFLRDCGFDVHGWGQGANIGPRRDVLDACRERIRELSQRQGRPVSLVGWSLGGLYARELAKEMPQDVRCVVTLGSPFTGSPRATNAWRLYEYFNGHAVDADPAQMQRLREPPPVPTTSIYSKSDGIVAWGCSVNDPAPRVENIEIPASHCGMGMNPLALFALADRLAQDPAAWQPFERGGLRRLFYPPVSQAKAA